MPDLISHRFGLRRAGDILVTVLDQHFKLLTPLVHTYWIKLFTYLDADLVDIINLTNSLVILVSILDESIFLTVELN